METSYAMSPFPKAMTAVVLMPCTSLSPGYEGLYFQGVAQNLKSEAFGFEMQKYNEEMIIVAPQLSD